MGRRPAPCAGQKEIDGVRNQLDVTEFFRGDICDQIVERSHLLASAEIE